MLHGQVQLGGFSEDVATIIKEAPRYAADLATLIRKAGAALPQAVKVIDKGLAYLPTILAVVEDPALPSLVQRIQTLRSMSKPTTAAPPRPGAYVPPTTTSSAPAVHGVGLSKIVPLIDKYIWVRRNPAVVVGVGLGGVAALVGVGFLIGRRRSRRS